MSLPNYQDCEYSLFISYAHDDDEGYNGWVQALKDAVWKRLSLLNRDIPRLNLHLSGVNGPATGRLGSQLEERVRNSFGMLIVVGPKYVSSGWCEKELELFNSAFGKDGFSNRLFIAAMSQPAIVSATAKQSWVSGVPRDQIWGPFFRKDAPGTPLDPMQNDGRFSGPFWGQACAMVDSLIAEIEKNWSATGDATPAAITVRPDGHHVSAPAAGKPSAKVRVLIGAATADLDEAVDALREKLSESGMFDIAQLSKERVAQWESVGGLGDDLTGAGVLVAPFSDAQPLNPAACAGGHLAIEQAEWARLGKPSPILWYRPQASADTGAAKASAKHLEFINGLSPVYASEEAIEAALSGGGAHQARVTIYIEKNPTDKKMWKPLGLRIGQLWEELNRDEAGAAMDLDIRTRALDIERLNRSQSVNDADGVILLFGEKHPESLQAQINRVEDSIPIRGPVFPGFVALLMPPRKPGVDDIGEHGWDFYRFNTQVPPGVREFDATDTEDLKDFLRDIREQHKNRTSTLT